MTAPTANGPALTSREFIKLRVVIKDAIDRFTGERTDKIGAFLDALHHHGWAMVWTGVLPEDAEAFSTKPDDRQPALPEIAIQARLP